MSPTVVATEGVAMLCLCCVCVQSAPVKIDLTTLFAAGVKVVSVQVASLSLLTREAPTAPSSVTLAPLDFATLVVTLAA